MRQQVCAEGSPGSQLAKQLPLMSVIYCFRKYVEEARMWPIGCLMAVFLCISDSSSEMLYRD